MTCFSRFRHFLILIPANRWNDWKNRKGLKAPMCRPAAYVWFLLSCFRVQTNSSWSERGTGNITADRSSSVPLMFPNHVPQNNCMHRETSRSRFMAQSYSWGIQKNLLIHPQAHLHASTNLTTGALMSLALHWPHKALNKSCRHLPKIQLQAQVRTAQNQSRHLGPSGRCRGPRENAMASKSEKNPESLNCCGLTHG